MAPASDLGNAVSMDIGATRTPESMLMQSLRVASSLHTYAARVVPAMGGRYARAFRSGGRAAERDRAQSGPESRGQSCPPADDHTTRNP